MEGGGYWLRAWVAVDDKWPTKTKTSQLWREKMINTALNSTRKKVTRILKHPLFALGSEMTIPPGFKTYNSSRFQDIYVLDEHNLIVSLAK